MWLALRQTVNKGGYSTMNPRKALWHSSSSPYIPLLYVCLLCMILFSPFPFICIPDLVADGTVVVGIHDRNLHCSTSDIQAIAGCDVEQIPVLLLAIQQTAHINLPLSLHEGQTKHAPRVPPWRLYRWRLNTTQQRKRWGCIATDAWTNWKSYSYTRWISIGSPPFHSHPYTHTHTHTHTHTRTHAHTHTDDAGTLWHNQ